LKLRQNIEIAEQKVRGFHLTGSLWANIVKFDSNNPADSTLCYERQCEVLRQNPAESPWFGRFE